MKIDSEFTMTINGQSCSSQSSIDVYNPATGSVFASAPSCEPDQLDAAVSSAKHAFQQWSETPYDYRAQLLHDAADVLDNNVAMLAKLFTAEHGRPLSGSVAEIQGSAQWLRDAAELRPPIHVFEDSDSQSIETHYRPLGVVAAIAPWNFPILLAIWKLAPALLAGNTVVLKPSPFTPVTTLKMGELFKDIFPSGVLNVISGDDSLGAKLTTHAGIDKISFTGSTATGKKVISSAANNLTRVTLELGGNDAAIVCDDINPEMIIDKIFFGAFHNNAQVCIATKRLYVHEAIYDDMLSRLVAMAKSAKIGDGMNDETEFGPVQNIRQYERLKSLIADTEASGASMHYSTNIPKTNGYFIPITIVDNPPDDAKVVREEAFGPVLPVLKFRTIEEVIERANNSEYGLASAVWSSDLNKAVTIANQLKTGTVWINHNLNLRADIPFAGHKQSGFGVENGVEGLVEFMAPQSRYISRESVN